MLVFEQLSIGYFAALGVAAPFASTRGHCVRRAMLAAAATILLVVLVSRFATEGVRIWAPHLYLVAGYWIPALVATRTPGRFESWLRASDAKWARRVSLSREVLHAAEAAYLFCYPIVPLGLLTVATLGGDLDVQRFWLAVLATAFFSYGSLPWLLSRPPRFAAGCTPETIAIHRLNEWVLGRISHQLNTFPSGHVAVSTAAAVIVLSVSTPAGIAFLIAAGGIALGAVAGRYHYVADVVWGAVLGSISALLLLAWTSG